MKVKPLFVIALIFCAFVGQAHVTANTLASANQRSHAAENFQQGMTQKPG